MTENNIYICNSLFLCEGQLCTFAWVLSFLGSIFIIILLGKLLCLLFDVDMRILIGKALTHLYML